MNLKYLRPISALAIILVFTSVFGNPVAVKANIFGDLLGNFGIGSNQSSSGYSDNYNYNGAQSSGDLELDKGARRVGRDSHYQSQLTVRSGDLIEIRIVVGNESSRNSAITTVQDELGDSVVYVRNSLRINGQTTNLTGLTSGGLRITIPADTQTVITYQMNVCGGSSYPTRASAYSAGIGSASDTVIIQLEDDYNNYNSNYSNNISTCLAQFQNYGTTNYGNGTTQYNSGTGFGTWTGVNNLTTTNSTTNNPFAGWTGVNNATTTTVDPNVNNPFAGWTGVNNSNVISSPNAAFGTWTGVSNADTSSTISNNPFAGWTGVDNSQSSPLSNDVFGTWYGVNNSADLSNPFGDWATSTGGNTVNNNSNIFGTWTGVNNSADNSNPFSDWATGSVASSNTGFDASGYSATTNNQTVAQADTSTQTYAPSIPNTYAPTPTTFVAPTTGVNPLAPIGFAGLLTAGFVLFRQRKWLFN